MVANGIDDLAEFLNGVVHRLEVLLDLLSNPGKPLNKDEEARAYTCAKREVGSG